MYTRKSSEAEDKQVASIEAQITELKKVAERNNLKVVKVFSEAQSAKEPGRPIFNEMVERIRSGEASGILCWKLDRLARNPVDGGQIQWILQQGLIEHIQTFERSYYPSDNVLMMSLELGVANQFIRDLSVNVKRGFRNKIENGWRPGVAPSGYLNTPDREKGLKIIVKDPERFDVMRKAWDMMLSGRYSVNKILDTLNNEWAYRTVKRRKIGGSAMTKSALYKIFTNPFYYGILEYPKNSGNYFQASHEPMITKEEFDKVQIRLGSKAKPRPHNRQFAYTGPIICGECECQITAEEKNQMICSECKYKFAYENKTACPKCETPYDEMIEPKVLNYIYYHCTKQKKGVKCSQGSILVGELENQILEYIKQLSLKQKYLDWALEYLREENTKEANTGELIVKNYQKEYNKVSKQLETLLDMRLNNEVEGEVFQLKKDQLTAEKHKYQELLGQADTTQDKRVNKCEDFFQFCHTAVQQFEQAKENKDLSKLREILATVGSNLVLKDKKLSIEPFKPFILLQKGFELVPDARATFEPKEVVLNKRKNTTLEGDVVSWLGRWDSNPRPIDYTLS